MLTWIEAVAVISGLIVSFAFGFKAGKHAGTIISEKAWSMRVDELAKSVSSLRTEVERLQLRRNPLRVRSGS